MAEIPATYNGFKGGMDNVQPDFALKPSVLRDAVNVDLFDDGNLRRRRGVTRRVGLPACHSLYGNGDLTVFVAGGTLYRLNPDFSTVALGGGFSSAPLAYLTLDGAVYFSDGAQTGKIVNGAVRPWGPEMPNGQPLPAAAPSGNLLPGTYQVAVTFVNDLGEESGTGIAARVDVAAGGGIQLTHIPQPLSAFTRSVRLYVTTANGDVLYRTADLAVGVTSFAISAQATAGHALQTQFLDAVPAGTQLAYHKGRLYVAAGNVLWYTEALRYGLSNRSGNFIAFAHAIRILAAVPDGLYVATDKTYFISDVATDQMQRVEVLPYSGVPGTVVYRPAEEQVLWFTARGPVLAEATGQIKAVAADKLAAGAADFGAAFYREEDSLRQLVTLVANPAVNPLAAASYVEADIVRKENL